MPVQPVSQLNPRPVAWLWPNRLALGKLAMLDGDPGLGKSLVTLDLCARLSTGRPFPDGSPAPGVGRALVLNGEDGDEDTIRPRLQALGANLENVFVWHRDEVIARGLLRLPSQTHALHEALAETHAQFVVIDPVMAFLEPGIIASSDSSVRRALSPLEQLADQHRCAVKLVRHLNKRGGSHSLYRGGGSIGFIGACRSGWLIARDPQAPAGCVLAQVKNNLAPPQPSLAFTVVPQEGAPPLLSWTGVSPYAADDLLAAKGTSPPACPRTRAMEFLESFLEAGPRTSREVWAAAEKQGLAERTLSRAKRELEVRSMQVWLDGSKFSYWLLPGQELPAGIPPDAVPPDLEEWLEPLRRRFPPSTPLDDL